MIEAAQESGRPRLQRRATMMRLAVDIVDRELAEEVREAVRQQPSVAEALWVLWHGEPRGPHVGALRTFARRRSRETLEGDDPVALVWWSPFGSPPGTEDGDDKVGARLRELDPEASIWAYGPLDRAIHDTTQRFNPDVGLEDLAELEEQVPASGPMRVKLERARAQMLRRLDRDADAHVAFGAVIEAGSVVAGDAVDFAFSAVRIGEDHDLALSHLETALHALEIEDYARDVDMASVGFAGWVRYQNRLTAGVLHARADVYTDLGRHDDAAASLLRACVLSDRAGDHEALAETYSVLGEDDAAFEHRLRAATLKLERSPDAFDESGVPEELRTAWEERPYWHHDGLEGLLAAQVTALEKEGRRSKRKSRPRLPIGPDHPLMGQPFPDLAYQVGKLEHHLSDHEERRGVDPVDPRCAAELAVESPSYTRGRVYSAARRCPMIQDELRQKSKDALKAGDKATRLALSSILGRFGEEEKSKGFDGWTEEAQRALVASHVKGLRQAVEQMKSGPIVEQYRMEIALLEPYMPQLLDEAATRALVEPIAANAHALGQFMGLVMKEHKGKVDPVLVRKIGGALGLK